MNNKLTKKINICHVLYSFDKIGGIENGVVNIINGLDTEKFRHVICSLTKIGNIQHRINNDNLSFYSFDKSEGNDFTLPFKLFKLFKSENIDVVHLRNWPTMVEGFVAAKLAGIKKIIYSEHGRHFEPVWNNEKVKSKIIKYILGNVDVCLCVSNFVAMEMAHLYRLTRKIDVIQNGVDIRKFKNNLNRPILQQFGIDNEIVIGTVGRLDKGKRFDELIIDFVSHCPHGHLIIIGEGPEGAHLKQLVNASGAGRVSLLGHQNNIPELLNNMDVFVLPSESEGLSNAIMEAVSCGLPVVAYDVGGNKEMVHHGKGGILVEWHRRDIFVSAINEILENQALANSMQTYNRQLASESFSIETMMLKYAQLYSDGVLKC